MFDDGTGKRLVVDGTGRVKQYQALDGSAEAAELTGNFKGKYAAERPTCGSC